MIIDRSISNKDNTLSLHIGGLDQSDHIEPILDFIIDRYNPKLKRNHESKITFTIEKKEILVCFDDILPLGIYAADPSANEIVEEIAAELKKLELVNGKLVLKH